MSGNPIPVDERLRELEQIAERTHDAYHQILAERRRPVQEGLGVGDDLAAYYADVLYKRRASRDREEETRLTIDFVDNILSTGYRIVPLDVRRPDAGFKVVSDEDESRLNAAQHAANEARDNVVRFRRENADKLAELAAKKQMERFRTALDGDDPEALTEAIAQLPQGQARNVLTTDDVPVAA